MSQNRFLVIGRGISGAVLSLKLIERGIPHDIVDEPGLSRSSKVAAGLLNPLVLKRMRLVQHAREFMEHAPAFYQKWETELQTRFYHPTPIRHNFSSHGEVNQWLEKSTLPGFRGLLGEVITKSGTLIPAPFGGGMVNGCGWLDTGVFLQAHLLAHQNFGRILKGEMKREELSQLSKDYDATILCSGHLMRQMFPEYDLFRPTRGEVMTISSKQIPEDAVIHGKVFIMPLGKSLFKVGSTYHWDDLSDITTDDGLDQLAEGLERLFSGAYTLVKHEAGVRPNVKDRKPLLGQFGEAGYYSFNGMGSRAVLMTPYLSKILADHLLDGTEIPDQYNIKRF